MGDAEHGKFHPSHSALFSSQRSPTFGRFVKKKMGTDLGFESSPRTPGGRWAQAPLGCPALPSISLTDTWHKTSI